MKLVTLLFTFMFFTLGISQEVSQKKYTFDIYVSDTCYVLKSCIPDSLYRSNFLRPVSYPQQKSYSRKVMPSNLIALRGSTWVDGCLVYKENYIYDEQELKTILTEITQLGYGQIIIDIK